METTPPPSGDNSTRKDPGSAFVLGVVSFLIGAVCAAAWIYLVMVRGGRHDFSHIQVVGACINVVAIAAVLTYWGYRQRIDATRVAGTVTISLSVAIGAVFVAIAAPTDSTGLWGVGFLIIVVCSLMGISVVTAVMVAVLRWMLSRS